MSGADSSTQIQTPKPVIYKECLKNHAARLGVHALDGCGEFMPSPAANPSDPTSLVCAACGCHRNFHRQENTDNFPGSNMTGTLPLASLNYQPRHRHTPPPPSPPGYGGGGGGGASSTPRSQSPSPISYSYYPCAPHLVLTLSGGGCTPVVSTATTPVVVVNGSGGGGKRFRTRFTQNQKDKMLEFAVKIGWKMQKKDEELIANFCNEIAVDKGVFKVWMHNNKNMFGKKDNNNSN